MVTTPIIRPVKPTFNAGSGLRSPLDKDDLTNSHKKAITPNSSTFNLAIQVQQHTVAINKLRRRVLTPPQTPPVQPAPLYPFSIYQINNVTDPTLSPLTFQVRTGVIGLRSKYITENNRPSYFNVSTFGNFEIPCEVLTDSLNKDAFYASPSYSIVPPTPNTGGNIQLLNGTDVIAATGAGAGGSQIVLDSQIDSPGISGDCRASLWLVIVDGPAGGGTQLQAQLWGRMFTDNAVSTLGRETKPFPDPDPSIVPIGIIGNLAYDHASPFTVLQLQSGNLINRFNPGVISGLTASPTYQRGYWSTDSLSGQVFWDGDNVVDDSHIIITISGSDFYGTYSYIGGSGIETSSPAINANFVMTGMVIL